MIFLSASILYFALSLPTNSPLIWWGPLSRSECLAVEQKTSGTWCHVIRIPKGRQ